MTLCIVSRNRIYLSVVNLLHFIVVQVYDVTFLSTFSVMSRFDCSKTIVCCVTDAKNNGSKIFQSQTLLFGVIFANFYFTYFRDNESGLGPGAAPKGKRGTG